MILSPTRLPAKTNQAVPGEPPNGTGPFPVPRKATLPLLPASGMSNNFKNQKGYIALISILIVSGVTFIIAISTGLFGISESVMGLEKNQSSQAYYLASLCAEDALVELKNDLKYSGNETLVFDEGTCTILKVGGGGNTNRKVRTIGTVHNQTRKIEIEIAQVDPKMQITSWQEVADF